jgi:lysophospholipase L1-like esterase
MAKNVFKIIIFLSIVVVIVLGIKNIYKLNFSKSLPIVELLPSKTPTPTVKVYKLIDQYDPPKIATASSYTLIFLGDSMTEALGENFDFLRLDLAKYYPNKVFGLFNYGFGSTDILSIQDRLDNSTTYEGKVFQAVLDRYFDIILIESLGTNPLSKYPLEIGLQKQTEALEVMVAKIADTHPDSLIVFVATIAPSQFYGKGVVDLSPEIRIQWANERRAYIENHISFAKKHNIPLINVYEKTLDVNGVTISKYINPGNYIHPSVAGVTLVSQTIADYLFQNEILLN